MCSSSVPRREEIVALTVKLAYDEGCTVLSFDGINVSDNSVYRHRILPAVADIISPVRRCAVNAFGRELPKLLYPMGGGATAVRRSAGGIQQGCHLRPLGYSARGVTILKEFKAAPLFLRDVNRRVH